jgi:tetratricopeptide (TPR) repeat protein
MGLANRLLKNGFMCLGMMFLFFPAIGGRAHAACAEQAGADGLVNEAGPLWAQKTPQSVGEAVKKLEQAAALCPDDGAAWTLLTQAYWQSGDWLPREQKDERLALFNKGEAAADKALALDPKSIDGLYWKTTNMASAADMKGWASSLWMFPTLLKNMDQVDAMDPHYYYGATKRFWTEVLFRVPLWLAGRFGYDIEKDVLLPIEDEIKREPRYLGNYVYAARILWKVGGEEKQQQALDYLDAALKADPNALPAEAGDNASNQRDARRLWKEFTGKDWPER